MEYTFLANLSKEITPPENGILSRVLRKDETANITLFAFSAGQELSAENGQWVTGGDSGDPRGPKLHSRALLRQDDRIDDVDHAVAGGDIGRRHARVIYHHAAVHCVDGDAPALDGPGGIELHQFLRHHHAR